MRNKINSVLPNSLGNTCFEKSTHFHKFNGKKPIKFASLQPLVKVAKRKVSFATMSHGCEGYFLICNRE